MVEEAEGAQSGEPGDVERPLVDERLRQEIPKGPANQTSHGLGHERLLLEGVGVGGYREEGGGRRSS